MARAGKAKGAEGANKKEIQRGTQDELEILAQIVQQNPALRQAINERLSDSKARHAARERSAAGVEGKSDKAS